MPTYRLEDLGSSLPQAGRGRAVRLSKAPAFERGCMTFERILDLRSESNSHAAVDGSTHLYDRRLSPFPDLGIPQFGHQLSESDLSQVVEGD